MSQDTIETPIPTKGLPKPKPQGLEGKLNNLAKDEELTAKFWSFVRSRFTRYDGQEQRRLYCKEKGVFDTADRMNRMTARVDDDTDQYLNTKSNVPSSIYHRNMRALSAFEAATILPPNDDELPAVFAPDYNTAEYNIDEGRALAEAGTTLEKRYWQQDARRAKIREVIREKNISTMRIIAVDWDVETETAPDKVVDRWSSGPNRIPQAFSVKEKELDVFRGPRMRAVEPEDFWCDAQIDGHRMEDFECTIERMEKTYQKLRGMYAKGKIANLDKLSTAHLYGSEEGQYDLKYQRQKNAGSDAAREHSNLFKLWFVYAYVPIKESGKESGRGKWQADSANPALYRGLYCGQMNGDVICLQLVREPTMQRPYRVIYSHSDKTGFYHMGWATMLQMFYWQDVTCLNIANDNMGDLAESPWWYDGALFTKDLSFDKNKAFQVAPGTKIEQLNIAEVMGRAMELSQANESIAEKLVVVGKPGIAQPMGGRTSALEAKILSDTVYTQLRENAIDVGEQLWDWLYHRDMRLARLYSVEKDIALITHGHELLVADPTKLWGPLQVKVTTSREYFEMASKAAELLAFMNTSAFPVAMQAAGKDGASKFFRAYFKARGLPEMSDLFGRPADADARRLAGREDAYMISTGQMDPVEPEDNHSVHKAVHAATLSEYELLSEARPEVMSLLKQHLQLHTNLETQMGVAGVGMNVPQAANMPGGPVYDQARGAMEATAGLAPQG